MNQLADTLASLPEQTNRMVDTLLKACRDLFGDHQGVSPVAFYILPMTGEIKAKEIPELSDESKPGVWKMLRGLRRTCPTVAFISEVWMAKCEPGDVNPDGTVKVMPRDNPNKTEWIMLNLWEGRRAVTFHAEITRNPDNLGEWEVLFDSAFPKKGCPDKVEGQMMEGQSFQMEEN